jgi:hypothetical protein
MINLSAIANEMSSNDIILTYQGLLDSNIISDLLDFVEERLKELEIKKPARKKVFLIMLESLQNSFKHGNLRNPDGKMVTTLALVQKEEEKFELILGNFLLRENKSALESKLKMIDGLSEKELKEKYLEVLSNGEQSDIGGSGLGLMDIARKSGNKLNYRFDEVDDDKCYFTLNIKIS